MKKIVLFVVMALMALVAMPIFAQDDAPIAPDAELTEFTSIDVVGIYYPEGLFVDMIDDKLVIAFNTATDFITVLPHSTFVAREYDLTDLQTIAQQVYADAVGVLTDAPAPEDGLTENVVGFGYLAYSFDIIAGDVNIAGYIFEVDGDFYAVTLMSLGIASTPYEAQREILARMVNGVYINGVAIGETTTTRMDLPQTIAFITENVQERPLPTTDEDIALEQVAPGADGTFILNLPASWVVDVEFGMYAAVSQDVLDRFADIEATYAPEEVAVQVAERLDMVDFELEEITALTVFASLYIRFENEGDVFVYETPDDTSRLIYYTPLTSEFVPAGAFIIVAQVGEAESDIVAVVGVAGDFDTVEPTLLAIVNGMVYVEAVEEE